MDEVIRGSVLEAIEVSLEAQLKAIRRLRKPSLKEDEPRKKARSHVDLVYDVLRDAGAPLHLREILARVEGRFSVKVNSDSLTSALSKYVVKGERFSRPAKNTFAVLEREDAG